MLNRLLASVATAGVLAAVVGLLSSFCADGGEDRAGVIDPWATPGESRRGLRLEVEPAAAPRRLRAKMEIVQQLIDGRITLPEAAGAVRDLLGETSPTLQVIRRWEKGGSDEECLCRHLIRMARETLEEEPQQATQVARRLEAELRSGAAMGQPPDPSSGGRRSGLIIP
jgi:hypothetical protein